MSAGYHSRPFLVFKPNTFADPSSFSVALAKAEPGLSVNPSLPVAEQVLARLKPQADFWSRFHEGIEKRPVTRWPIHYEELAFCNHPHFTFIIKSAQTLQALALAQIQARQFAAALESIETSLRVSRNLSQDSNIGAYVGGTVIYLASEPIREGLLRAVWSEDQLNRLDAALRPLSLLADVRQGNRSAWVSKTEIFLKLKQGFDGEFLQFAQGAARFGEIDFWIENPKILHRLLQCLPIGLVQEWEIQLARFDQDVLIDAVHPETGRIDFAAASAGKHRLAQGHGIFSSLARVASGTVLGVLRKMAQHDTTLHLARVAIALEKHRLHNNGQYPEALTALNDEALTRDPYAPDHGSFRYQKTATQYTLYSVGPNGKDDHAEPAPRDEKALTEGDWVWWRGN